MPLYFVDISDGRTETRDDVGTDMSDPEAARGDVMRMLAETAKFEAAHGGEYLLVATVRDGADQELYRVVLALTCSRTGQEAPCEGAIMERMGKVAKSARHLP